MTLTAKQEECLKIAVERYKNKEPYTCISGYAGAGKSTIIKFIISALNLFPDDVAYVAFTGKAAEVLRNKKCPNACTAHKLLYYASKTIDGKFMFRPRKTLEKRFKLIIVDEVSMLPKDLWDLLLSHKIPVIATGDPGQLPPINKDQDNHVLDNPHFFLDEVMRQAQDSEIIRLSMDIREGKELKYFKGQDVMVIPKAEMVSGMYLWADQILVGTNKVREQVNREVRSLLNRGAEPEKGDKLISLCNHWDNLDFNNESALVNGTIGYLGENYIDNINYPVRIKDFPKSVKALKGQFVSESGADFGYLTMDYKSITEGVKTLTPRQEYIINNNKMLKGSEPFEFAYGYAITVHRAQGSEWNKVLIFEERFPFDKEEHKKWLYTAVTRSEERVVLVR